MHSGIVNGYQLMCDAHIVIEQHSSLWAQKNPVAPSGDFMTLYFSESTLYTDMFFTYLP